MSVRSSDTIDYLFDQDDCRAAEDSLRSTLFSNDSQPLKIFKDEFCDDVVFDWRHGLQTGDFNVDELLGSCLIDNGLNPHVILSDDTSMSQEDTDERLKEEDFQAFKDIVSLPFDAVMNSFDPGFEAASDSGLSTDNLTEFMMSPSSGTASPDPRVDISVDTTDAVSDVSSTSDLGSLGSVGSSPSGRSDSSYSYTPIRFDLGTSVQSQYDSDDVEMKNVSVPVSERGSIIINSSSPKRFIASPQFFTKLSSTSTNSTPTSISTRSFKVELQPTKIIKHVNTVTGSSNNITTSNLSSSNITTFNTVSNNIITSNSSSLNNITTKTPVVAKVRLDSGCKNGTLKTSSPQTIVVTQPGKVSSFIRNTAFLKAAASGRPILVPVNVNVNDLNQMKKMKSIKIISTSTTNNRPGIRTLVSTVRPVSTSASGTTGNRTTLYTTTSKGSDGRSLIKVTPTAFVTPNSHTETPHISVTPSYIKEEPSDDEAPQPNQELVLTEEEKRLMRKEGLTFPARYPLTKQEERDLKRIRRKIRNKISAQDSRKRKKEYVDGLEDRVKNCTEENQQLQKRIKTLEKQNESLLAQLKKFQNLVGLHSRHHTHASTALMMLILSTALFVVPSLRSQDGKGENELAGDSKIPSTGHTRSLLEVKNAALNMKNLDGFPSTDDDDIDPLDYTNALSDHDYAPFAKRPRLENMSPTYYSAPSVDKTLPRENGEPPDSGGGLNGIAALIGAMLDRIGNNWTDPGGSFGSSMNLTPPHGPPDRSVVVNLNHGKRLRDDIELE